MGLEYTISDEEIVLSRRISRQKTLFSLSAGVLAGLAAAYFHHEDHRVSQPYFSLLHGLFTSGFFTTLLSLPVNIFSRRGLPLVLRNIGLGLRYMQGGNLEEKIARNEPASIQLLEEAGWNNLIRTHGILSTRTHLYEKEERFADYIFTKNNVQVQEFRVLPEEVSDHAALFLECSLGDR